MQKKAAMAQQEGIGRQPSHATLLAAEAAQSQELTSDLPEPAIPLRRGPMSPAEARALEAKRLEEEEAEAARIAEEEERVQRAVHEASLKKMAADREAILFQEQTNLIQQREARLARLKQVFAAFTPTTCASPAVSNGSPRAGELDQWAVPCEVLDDTRTLIGTLNRTLTEPSPFGSSTGPNLEGSR